MWVAGGTIRKFTCSQNVFRVISQTDSTRVSHRYGIVCMLIPFALVMAYLIYTKPPFFPLGLLALNGANLTM
jgi:hypothetical protein